MKTISDREVFIATVNEGSLTQAAERLGLSLAVCSKRLAMLEQRLSVRLLNRTTRRQHLTDEGEIYFEHCLRIQEEIDAMESNLAGMRETAQGTLRVTMPTSFGRKHISPFVPEFLTRYPGISLHLMATDTVVDMVGEGIDVGVRIGALASSSLVAAKLANNYRVLCVSPSYLERKGAPQTLDDLKTHDCLVLSSQTGVNGTWEFEIDQKINRIAVNVKLTTNSGEVVRDAAVAGLGIGIKSLWDISDQLVSGELTTVLDDYPLVHSDIHAVYHNRKFLSPKVRAWVDFFKEKFGDTPYWEKGLSRYTD